MDVWYEGWKPTESFYEAVDYGIHALCLEEIPGELTIELVSDYPDAIGDCYFDGIDSYHIRLSSPDISTLFHEMTHVMQYANYELEVYREGYGYWQGKMHEGLSYYDSPWEVEAFHMEQVLTRCFEAQQKKSS